MTTLIVGPPGAGKSHKAREIAHGREIIDDPKSLGDWCDVVITDPFFCFPHIRAAAKAYFEDRGEEVEFIYFENDIEKCRRNIERRNDGREVKPGLFCSGYAIPEGVEVLEIYSDFG